MNDFRDLKTAEVSFRQRNRDQARPTNRGERRRIEMRQLEVERWPKAVHRWMAELDRDSW